MQASLRRSCLLFFCLLAFSTTTTYAQTSDLASVQNPPTLDATPLLSALRNVGWLDGSKPGLIFSGTSTTIHGHEAYDRSIRGWAFGATRFRLETVTEQGIRSEERRVGK